MRLQSQAASSTHSDFPTTLGTLLQPFVRKLACPSRYPFNASSACHNLTALCYTLWCVDNGGGACNKGMGGKVFLLGEAGRAGSA